MANERAKVRNCSKFAGHVAAMTRPIVKMLIGAVLLAAIGCESLRAQSLPGPQGAEEGAIRRQMWLVPAHDRRTMMRTLVYRPPGPGPFPLVVVNHGTTRDAALRTTLRAEEFAALAQWFVARGYAVAAPQRPGLGETGGLYYEDHGACAQADFGKAGFGAAGSIGAAIEYLTRQAFVRKTGVVVVGHSAGGWGALALTTRNLPAVKAVVAFAPGRGGRMDDVPGRNCAPDRLIAAARTYGEKSRLPILWMTSANDSFFGPDLTRKLVDAFRVAGGRVEQEPMPAFGPDGHYLIYSPDAVALWGPPVERFLARVR